MLPMWLWAKLVVKVVFKSVLLLYGVREVTNVMKASEVTWGGLHHTLRTKSAFTGHEQEHRPGEKPRELLSCSSRLGLSFVCAQRRGETHKL